nr:hypothetical protein [Tanacetum cinerariifolium]
MKAPIVFPPLSMEDALDEPLIIEAVMEGHLVHRLEVVFGDGGLFRTVMINFTIVRAPSPYNVIFVRTVLRSLRAVSSTIHSMVKFPTQRGIATLVTRSAIIFECRMFEKKKMVEQVELVAQKKGSGIRQNLGGNQRSGRMGKRRNSSSGADGARRQRKNCVLHGPRGNLDAYVDDMVIKSNDEKVLIADITETFNNLWRINMKLNLKKCSFGVEEGKFLGYMVTSEGIRANPKKTKAIADMKSPRTLKEMQSLRHNEGKQGRIPLDRKREKGVPRDENGHSRVVIANYPVKEETLYIYVEAATEALNAMLLAERKGK